MASRARAVAWLPHSKGASRQISSAAISFQIQLFQRKPCLRTVKVILSFAKHGFACQGGSMATALQRRFAPNIIRRNFIPNSAFPAQAMLAHGEGNPFLREAWLRAPGR